MTSELDEFLADLGGRRHRLLQSVDPDDPTALIEELTEFGEQLVMAEEELRVQQEELLAAGARIDALVQEREELRSSAPQPYVLTDRRGVVLRTNPAADRLIRRPAIRVTSRPIATWFEVADRPAVRTVITRVTSGQQDRAEVTAVLKRSDRTTVTVHVTVTSTPGGDPLEPELLWRLEDEQLLVGQASASGQPPALQLVAEPESASEPAASAQRELANELTALAVELAACETEEHLLAVAVEHARRLVPHAQHAGVLLHRRGTVERAASTDEPVPTCLRYEIELREGPALAVLAQRLPALLADTRSEQRWTAFAQAAAEAGVRSILAVDVAAGVKALGALALYSESPHAFDSEAVAVASMVATQLGLSLNHLRMVHNLQAGLLTRAEIGEAMGVLMERHRITSQDAFQMLVLSSQKNNVKLHTIAQVVAETGQDPAVLRVR